jgi:glutathione synthase/RimK-type ligase-like ATP-grasp enzyme
VLPSEIRRPSHQQFALTESHEAFSGLWHCLRAFWVNPPLKDEAAHRKAYQLLTARRIGLATPRTLISNDPVEVRSFVEKQGAGKTIYKSFSATQQEWRETRLLKADELEKLDNVRFAPVIFQEYIEAVYDIRITMVGDEIFAAAIHSQQTSYKVDFRMDIANASVEAVELPSQVADGLRRLMCQLGLIYGAIDMRLTPQGRYVFLEVNPAGQWLFVEEKTGQPIAASLASLLARKDQSRGAEGGGKGTGQI